MLVTIPQDDLGLRPLRLASAILLVLSTLAMLVLTHVEHVRSSKPSILLSAYTLVLLTVSIIRTRTAWLAFGHQTYTVLIASSTLLTAVITILQAIPQARRKDDSMNDVSPEEGSGLYSLAFFSWLLPLIRQGNRKILDTEDLTALDPRLSAEKLGEEFQRTWRHREGLSKESLVLVLWKSQAWSFLQPVPSRAAMIVFAFCQPIFIKQLINYMEGDNADKRTHPMNLVLASLVIYAGIAFSTSSFHYLNQRASAKIRGVLVGAMFQKTMEISASHLDTSILTLMSGDIDRIQRGYLPIHELWALSFQVTFSAWLLYLQLGAAFVAPIVIVLACAVVSFSISGLVRSKVLGWTGSTERRVKLTNAVVSSMKSVKISGIAAPIERLLQLFRKTELRALISLRLVAILAITNAFLPTYVSPVVTFFAAGRQLGMAEAFASLSYLILLTGPLNQLFQKVPAIVTGLASMQRIQEFLDKKANEDYRFYEESSMHGASTESPAATFENFSAGWTEGKWQLRDIVVKIPQASLTAITGPVASGKSTLCRVLLGEVSFTKGTLRFHHLRSRPKIGYCEQTPFLVNGSVRSNIIGFQPLDAVLYDQVLDAALLKPDLQALPRGDRTEVGSGGVTLSGGQKQRVALARALYLDADIYVLDDFTVGLDRTTADEIVKRLFRPDGLLLRRKATVVWCTHTIHYLALAHHVVALSAEGNVLHQGHPDEVLKDRRVALALDNDDDGPADAEKKDGPIHDAVAAKPNTAKDSSRALNGMDVYTHYFSCFSAAILLTTICVGISFGFFSNFANVWLKFWTENSFNIPGPESHINGFYLWIYAANSVLIILSMIVFVALVCVRLSVVSGSALHLKAVRALMSAPLHFLTTTDQGVIVNYFSQDMNLLDQPLPNAMLNLFAFGMVALGQIIVLALGAPYIALTYPFLAVILYLLTRYYLRTSRQLRLLELENKSPLYAQFADAVRGITSVRAFGWPAAYTAQHHRLLDDSQNPLYLLSVTSIWLSLVLRLIVVVLAVAITLFSTLVLARAGRGPGFVGAGFVSLMELGEMMNTVIQCWVEFEMSLGAVKRLRDFGSTAGAEDKVGEDLRPGKQWPERGEVVINGVDASYAEEKYTDDEEADQQQTLALAGLSARIAAGEKVAVVGRTGSGKSSLLLLLLRLLDPTGRTSDGDRESTITIDGLPLQRIHRATLRERIIAMPQDAVFLAAGETFREALDPAGGATYEECRAALQRVGLLGAVEDGGGLDAKVERDVLSQGQKQLFSLAVAMLRAWSRRRETGPEGPQGGVLLLDEVTANVDRETEETIMGVVEDVFRDYTVIAVTHSLESVVKFDRVLVMADGHVVKEGTPAMLIREEKGAD